MAGGDISRIPSIPQPPPVPQVERREDAGEDPRRRRPGEEESEKEEEEETPHEGPQDVYEGASPENAELTPEELSALQASQQKASEEDGEAPPHIDLQA